MPKQPINTRQGGHAKETKMRQVVANPDGSREERRAAKKLKVRAAGDMHEPRPYLPNIDNFREQAMERWEESK